LQHSILLPDFKSVWTSVAAGATASPGGIVEPFRTVGPFWLPTINTALLLSSGVTLTIAHHALLASRRSKAVGFMWVTVLLGFAFLCIQGYEYHHLYTELNLRLDSGIYGSTFFMLTGFHGFHVFVGMVTLFFITLRLQAGNFTPKHHFGLEGAAWYWHLSTWCGLACTSLSTGCEPIRPCAAPVKKRRQALFHWQREGFLRNRWRAAPWAGCIPACRRAAGK